MKKIISLLTALALLICLSAGCEKNTENSSENESSQEISQAIEEKDAKDIFKELLFFNNRFDPELFNMMINTEYVGSEGKPLKLDANIDVDGTNNVFVGDFSIAYAEETLSGDIFINNDDSFFSVPDINSLTYRSDGITELTESTVSDGAAITDLITAYSEYLQKGRLDPLFSKAEGELTVFGEKIEGAVIATFEITDEKVKELCGDSYGEELSIFDIRLKIDLAVKDGEYKGFRIDGSVRYTDSFDYDYTKVISGEGNDSRILITMTEDDDYSDFEEGYYTKNDYTLDINISENGSTEGRFTILITTGYGEGEEYTYEYGIPFTTATESDGTKVFTIEKLENITSGITMSFDLGIVIKIKETETELVFSTELNAEIAETSLDHKLTTTLTAIDSFEHTPPSEYEEYEEYITEFEESFEEKYPNLYDFLLGYSDEDYDDYSEFSVYDEELNTSYYFDTETGIGDYSAYMAVEAYGNGKATLNIDGKTVEVEYGTPVYDDNELSSININGMEFTITDYPADDYFPRSLDICYYSPTYTHNGQTVADYINFSYYPENTVEGFDNFVSCSFTFTAEGDEYTIEFPDGTVTTKTVFYDEEYERY